MIINKPVRLRRFISAKAIEQGILDFEDIIGSGGLKKIIENLIHIVK